MTAFHFRSGSEFDIETLARLYTRTFEGYVQKAVITPELLRTWIEVEDLQLELSPVLCVGDIQAGFATVGLRGNHAYCRGFGIVPEYRGQGLANALSREMVERARGVSAVDMVLGVLIDNTNAVKSYRASGFEPVRELHSLEWLRGDEIATEFAELIVEIESLQAFARFDALHPVRPVWNRDLPSLEKMSGLKGLAIEESGIPCAYVLYREGEDRTEILDLALMRSEDAARLVRSLQSKFTHIVCYNEPAPGPALLVLRSCGFAVTHRRYEMRVGGLT